VVLLITALFTRKHYLVAKEISGIQLLYNLLNEYSSPEMATAYGRLITFFHDDCGDLKENVRNAYLTFKNNKSQKHLFLTFEKLRRIVSHFYQKLATFHEEKVIKDKLLFETWNEENLSIIDQVIIEIEKAIEGYSENTIDKLNRLYEDSKEYKRKSK
jgi:hypothetical protein